MKKYIVITTIHPKSRAINLFEQEKDWHIIVVADKKSQLIPSSDNLTFLSVEEQLELDSQFAKNCPFNHYARKNIGYLYAIQQGADIIYDTDDDNLPYKNWNLPDFTCDKRYVAEHSFVNIYEYFTSEKIWPRGYPLDEILKPNEANIKDSLPVNVGIWQGLVDLDPDVDAVFRLTVNKEIRFEAKESVYLGKKHYCPINSQNTFWTKKTFPYLYLPVTTSFRFTDILRGYITQRLLWENDLYIGFMKATVYQERNNHNLMKDFEDEIESYLNIKSIVELLDSLDYSSKALSNIELVYQLLVDNDFVKQSELMAVKAWMSDMQQISST